MKPKLVPDPFRRGFMVCPTCYAFQCDHDGPCPVKDCACDTPRNPVSL